MWNGNEKIFKTYLKGNSSGDGKSPAEKIKNVDTIRTFEEASQCECFGGILRDDFIDISFDTPEMYESFLKMAEKNDWRCLCLPSSKGGHTYWKNRGIEKGGRDKKLAVGFIADIHHKGTYIPLRVHNVDRFPPDYDILEGEEYQEVPDELLPVETNIVLQDLKEGDGRNDDLFRYILILQSQLELSKNQIRNVLKNTNEFVFTEPLSDSELDVILRDGAFQKQIFFKGNKFLHDIFAGYIKTTYNIKKVNGQLHIYQDGVYIHDYNKIRKCIIKDIPSLTDAKITEVLKRLDVICDEYTIDERSANMIAFRNGIYDLETDSLKPFSPDVVITNRIPWDYNPTAYSELADKTLDKIACFDAEIRTILEECIGSCFYRSNTLGGGKAFILTGEGSNGKSTFIEVLQTVLGESNYSVLDLKNLDAKFSTIMLVGKLANLGDDISDEFNADISMFKKIVTGNYITAQQKGQPEFQFKPYLKLIFSANEFPRIRDRTGAMTRRLLMIPFEARFSKNDADYDNRIIFKLKEQDSIEYFIKLGIDGLKRVLLNQSFTESEKVNRQLEEYKVSNNPVLSFIEEVGADEIENQSTKEVFLRYSAYCIQNGFRPISNISFSKQICRTLNFCTKQKKVKDKKYQIFCKMVQDSR